MLRQPRPGRLRYRHLAHPVHPVVDVAPRLVIGHQIVVPLHTQRHRIHRVPRPAPAVGPLPLQPPVKIPEGDLPGGVDGLADGVDVVVELLVGGLDAVHHIHLPPQLLGLVAAGKVLQLPDELHALFLGKEGGRLNHIHQHLQLRQLKLPAAQIEVAGFGLGADNVHAELLQQCQIVVDGLPLGADAQPLQIADDILYRRRVHLIGPLQEKPGDIQQLQLLMRHGTAPRGCR